MNEYTKVNWQDGTVLQPAKVTIDGTDYEVEPAVESGTTPVNATNLDKMDTALKQAHDSARNMERNKIDKSTIELLTVDSTAPEHCSEGDMYYNTTTNYIYTATATDTWGTTGELPSSKYLYVDLTNSKLYYYDGTTFTSYGGGSSNDVVISPDQPTGDDWKIWIDTGEVGSAVSEITNEYSTSIGLGYSANYVNNLHTYSTDEIRVGTWIDNKPLYRKVINFGALPNNTTKNVAHNIANLGEVINISGRVKGNAGYYPIPLQYKGSDSNFNVECFIDSSNVSMVSNTNRSSYSAYVIIEYTKTTD